MIILSNFKWCYYSYDIHINFPGLLQAINRCYIGKGVKCTSRLMKAEKKAKCRN